MGGARGPRSYTPVKRQANHYRNKETRGAEPRAAYRRRPSPPQTIANRHFPQLFKLKGPWLVWKLAHTFIESGT